MNVRLNKLMAERGIGARRKCDELIEQGAVKVNGEVVRTLGVKVDPQRDRVMVGGKPLPGPSRHRYFALYKPVGVITTLSDPEGRRTIREMLPGGLRLYPVGRLDADTSGLLLVTNDGELAHKLMHPRYGVEKFYRVLVTTHPEPAQVAQLQRGVMYDPGTRSAPARVRVREPIARGHVLEIAIHEGRYRQVRRMCEAVGLDVIALHRWGYGPLRLGELERGMTRELSEDEVSALREACARPGGTGEASRGRGERPRRLLAGGIGFAALRRDARKDPRRRDAPGGLPPRPEGGPASERRERPGERARRPAPPRAGERSRIRPDAPPRAGERSRIRPAAPPRAGERPRIRPAAPPRAGERSRIRPAAPPRAGERSRIRPDAPPRAGQRSRIRPDAPPRVRREREAPPAARPSRVLDAGAIGRPRFRDAAPPRVRREREAPPAARPRRGGDEGAIGRPRFQDDAPPRVRREREAPAAARPRRGATPVETIGRARPGVGATPPRGGGRTAGRAEETGRPPRRTQGRPRPIDWRRGGSPMAPERPTRRAGGRPQRPGAGRNPRSRGGEGAGPARSPRGPGASPRRGPGRAPGRPPGRGRPRP